MKGGNTMKIILDVGEYMPTYAHGADAGMDLRTPVAFIVPAYGSYTVDTGVHIQIPVDHFEETERGDNGFGSTGRFLKLREIFKKNCQNTTKCLIMRSISSVRKRRTTNDLQSGTE